MSYILNVTIKGLDNNHEKFHGNVISFDLLFILRLKVVASGIRPGPEVIKLFMLNSAEHEILNAHKYKITKKFSFFQAQKS